MMGTQVSAAQLFYDFCLDDHVPADHLLQRIDRFLDRERVRTALKPFYTRSRSTRSTRGSPLISAVPWQRRRRPHAPYRLEPAHEERHTRSGPHRALAPLR
jgi:hypothetical protein